MLLKLHKEPISNRQLKVGEIIRRVLIEIFIHDLYDRIIEEARLTVTEVKVSPDLKQANVYISPLFGKNINRKELMLHLKSLNPKIRYLVTNKVKLRSSPEIKFKYDNSFDEAAKIQKLLDN